jgi:hypothetical protein
LSNAFIQSYFRAGGCPFGPQPQGRPRPNQDCQKIKIEKNRDKNTWMLAVVTVVVIGLHTSLKTHSFL